MPDPKFVLVAVTDTACLTDFRSLNAAALSSRLRRWFTIALLSCVVPTVNAQELDDFVSGFAQQISPEASPQSSQKTFRQASREGSAQPYRPDSANTVVSILPDAVVKLAAQVRRQAAAVTEPASANGSSGSAPDLRQIMATYQLAERDNSARGYGHTLSLIQRWPADKPKPSLLLLIKAAVLQHNHAFAESRRELDALLLREPDHRRALQMASQVSMVMANYDSAGLYCAQLSSAGYAHSALNCRAQVDGLTGRALPALSSVTDRLSSVRLSVTDSFELATTAADIARRLGRDELARSYYRTALALSPNNQYVLTSYSDWLLQQEQSAAVIELLGRHEAVNTSFELQLILARARQLAGSQLQADREIERLQAATSAMARRGADRPHKLVARFQLWFGSDTALALNAAQANWTVQKEPSDARLLAEAALAADNSKVLEELQQWADETGLEYQALKELLARAGGRS